MVGHRIAGPPLLVTFTSQEGFPTSSAQPIDFALFLEESKRKAYQGIWPSLLKKMQPHFKASLASRKPRLPAAFQLRTSLALRYTIHGDGIEHWITCMQTSAEWNAKHWPSKIMVFSPVISGWWDVNYRGFQKKMLRWRTLGTLRPSNMQIEAGSMRKQRASDLLMGSLAVYHPSMSK